MATVAETAIQECLKPRCTKAAAWQVWRKDGLRPPYESYDYSCDAHIGYFVQDGYGEYRLYPYGDGLHP